GPRPGGAERDAAVRRTAHAGHQPVARRADPQRSGAAARHAARPRAPYARRGRRQPAERRVPQLALLARAPRTVAPAAAALALPELHLPAGAGRARRPGRRAGARAAGGRAARTRRTARALRRGGPAREPLRLL